MVVGERDHAEQQGPSLEPVADAPEADALGDAYRFLRRLENFIQAIRDRQTHDLPKDAIDRERLRLAMGFSSWEALLARVDEIRGTDVLIVDDMVRTGSTVVKSCQFLKAIHPGRMVFAVTHFYASEEGREKMASTAIDEILTLNTLPTIQNRDEQGRLRKKMVVLKIEKWLARSLREILGLPPQPDDALYQIEMSSKNPRFIRKIYSSDQLRSLKQEELF